MGEVENRIHFVVNGVEHTHAFVNHAVNITNVPFALKCDPYDCMLLIIPIHHYWHSRPIDYNGLLSITLYAGSTPTELRNTPVHSWMWGYYSFAARAASLRIMVRASSIVSANRILDIGLGTS